MSFERIAAAAAGFEAQYDHMTTDEIRALPHGTDLLARLHYHEWPDTVPLAVRDTYEPNWRDRQTPEWRAYAAADRAAQAKPLTPDESHQLHEFLDSFEPE